MSSEDNYICCNCELYPLPTIKIAKELINLKKKIGIVHYCPNCPDNTKVMPIGEHLKLYC